ncbi:MAG: hypothetical protein ACK5OX_09345, partial [Desertimonas sp.]
MFIDRGRGVGFRRWPDAGSPARTDTDRSVDERQIATTGFPYAVVHRVRDDVVQILAVHDQRRLPEYWGRTIQLKDLARAKVPGVPNVSERRVPAIADTPMAGYSAVLPDGSVVEDEDG